MNYTEFKIIFPVDSTEDEQDIVVAELGERGFESFSQDGNEMSAYINESEYEINRIEIESYIATTGYQYSVNTIWDNVNWNAAWESNFEPISVGDSCYVRAPFHESIPGVKHEIVIMPKMSFGTGHHSTTHLMLNAILAGEFEGKRGLDMGSGTGVLAILAVKCGAASVDAVDIDEWAYNNCIENIAENGVADKINPILGDASAIGKSEIYDFIFANINRNILLADMSAYVSTLKKGGKLYMSGFLNIDVPVIERKAISEGLNVDYTESKEGWSLIICSKS